MAQPEHAVAFAQIRTGEGFASAWGVTTAERRHRCFNFSTWCPTSWHGPIWPFESAKLGTALINALHDVRHRRSYAQHVGAADFAAFLRTYAQMHTRGRARDVPRGEPFVGESFHGDDGYWLTRELMYQRKQGDRKRGDHYFHSSYCDLVLSGLVGLHVTLPKAVTASDSRRGSGAARDVESDDEVWPHVAPAAARRPKLVVDPLVTADSISYFLASGMLVHGREVTVAYDATGTKRYGGLRGLGVWVDGKLVASARRLRRLSVVL